MREETETEFPSCSVNSSGADPNIRNWYETHENQIHIYQVFSLVHVACRLSSSRIPDFGLSGFVATENNWETLLYGLEYLSGNFLLRCYLRDKEIKRNLFLRLPISPYRKRLASVAEEETQPTGLWSTRRRRIQAVPRPGVELSPGLLCPLQGRKWVVPPLLPLDFASPILRLARWPAERRKKAKVFSWLLYYDWITQGTGAFCESSANI